jgi:DNA-directed RNA polymerase III subunit RPC3
MVVRVNYEKCITVLRTQKLEGTAKRFLGPVTGAVYGALLRCVEDTARYNPAHLEKRRPKPKSTDDIADEDGEEHDEDDEHEDEHEDDDEHGEDEEEVVLPRITDREVLSQLDESVNLELTTKLHDPGILPNSDGNPRKRKVLSSDADEAALGIKREAPSDNEDDLPANPTMAALKARNRRLHLISHHLDVLAEHPKAFVMRTPGKQESRLNISTVTNHVLNAELDTMIQARYGKHAIRLIRLLRDHGKYDDRRISEKSLLDTKYVRSILTRLQFDGIVDIQELHKDNTRQPSRTVYLYEYRPERVKSVFLQQAYVTMARLLQRLGVEREAKFHAVIEKAERLEGNLNAAETELLKQWRELEERFLVQVGRVDEIIAVLRDFDGDLERAMIA